MKALKKTPVLLFGLILALIITVISVVSAPVRSASAASSTSFSFTSYKVKYDVRSDRTMDVQMDLTAHYTGYASRGFYYDIPVNAGDRVRNVKAYKLVNGEESPVTYNVESSEEGFISIAMDDDSIKTGKTISYRIKYEYAITKPEKNELNLNAIGFGSEAPIYDVSIEINLPDGMVSPHMFLTYGSDEESYGYKVVGNKVTYNIEALPAYQGVTFNFVFEDGALSTKPDMTPYWIVIVACVVLAALFALKFLCFNKNSLTPIPCFSVPTDDPTQEMDPLIMGKLIDNKVDNSDVTSLIYYWANRGYIKINTENEKDIVLIRIYKNLPEQLPNYQKVMFNSIFAKDEVVHINSLTNTFYPTVEKVTKEVNSKNGKLYDKKSMAVAIAFAVIGALAMCLTPIIITMSVISHDLISIVPLIMLVPVFVIFALTLTVKYKTLKLKKTALIGLYAAIGLLALAFTGFNMLITPDFVMENLASFVLSAICFAIVMLSVSLVCRTEEYSERLNRIVGFKEFIETVEKDKLETMLESNPEFYYNVLPYAIVLGVSDKWADKFDGLTMKPPSWSTGSFTNTVFNVMVFNSLMRNINVNMAKTFLSRPSSGSASGFHGGFGGHSGFGGFGGGGHGGGGFRGR